MPLVTTLRGDHLEIVCAGDYSAQEIREIYRDVLSRPACPEPLPVLCIVQASSRSASTEEMREISGIYRDLHPRVGPRIAMAASDDLNFGLCRMFAAHVEAVGYESRVFREPRPAREWLRSHGEDRAQG